MLLICGDFEAIRDKIDLQTMAVPQKYKHMGDFHKFVASDSVIACLKQLARAA